MFLSQVDADPSSIVNSCEQLFLDVLFLDVLTLDMFFLDVLCLDVLFLEVLFLDVLFLDVLFLNVLTLDVLFLEKRKEKTTPFGVSLMRSQVLYHRRLPTAVSGCAVSCLVMNYQPGH